MRSPSSWRIEADDRGGSGGPAVAPRQWAGLRRGRPNCASPVATSSAVTHRHRARAGKGEGSDNTHRELGAMTSADEPVTPPSPAPRPHGDMAARYDVVVVGSGYGGAIAASRLARAGRSVCVLERGREIPAGDFPETLASAAGSSRCDAGPAGSAAPPGCSTCGRGRPQRRRRAAPSAGPRSSTPASPCARSRGCTTTGGLPSCGARTSAPSSSPPTSTGPSACSARRRSPPSGSSRPSSPCCGRQPRPPGPP